MIWHIFLSPIEFSEKEWPLVTRKLKKDGEWRHSKAMASCQKILAVSMIWFSCKTNYRSLCSVYYFFTTKFTSLAVFLSVGILSLEQMAAEFFNKSSRSSDKNSAHKSSRLHLLAFFSFQWIFLGSSGCAMVHPVHPAELSLGFRIRGCYQ